VRASSLDPAEAKKAARAAAGLDAPEEPDEQTQTEILFGDDIQALSPAVVGSAIQVLPLAVCA
jgi:hypothetical protein